MMVLSNVRVFTHWLEFPSLPEGGAGWSQTGYPTPGFNPSWNAGIAFFKYRAGCPPVQFTIPVETDIAGDI